MKASPPMPVMFGSVTFSTAAIAIAASTALPPRLSTSRPVCDASGWLEATIAWLARAADRPACTPENQSGICCPSTVTRQPSATTDAIAYRMYMFLTAGSPLPGPGLDAPDRPDILSRLFHQRVSKILARLLDILHHSGNHIRIRGRQVLRLSRIRLEIVKRQLDV